MSRHDAALRDAAQRLEEAAAGGALVVVGPPAPVERLAVRLSDAAALCGVAPETLRRWRELPRVRLGRRCVLFIIDDLRQYLAAHRETPRRPRGPR